MTINSKPNFLVIVADDLGFTDLLCFGGEISTPNLAKLASTGTRLTDFHTASACSPTRLMLLSGTDNHIAGLGQMAEFARNHPEKFEGKPGYEGYLNDRVAALPEILQDNGYYTFITGKWHLGLTPEHWPVKRGFEKLWTLLPGAGNHFKYIYRDENGDIPKFLPPLFADNDREVDPEKELPDDFYLTEYFTSKGLEFIKDPERNGRPFFGSLTYTAPHWPYQAPADRIAKYKGKYNAGPEELRQQRLKAATKLGIIGDGIVPHPVTTVHKRWHELSAEERAIEARIMETYAAMVEILDEQIGRVLDYLEEIGELDNTVVFFMSDNGAEGMLMEALPLTSLKFSTMINAHYDNSLDNIGRANSFVYYNDQWAQAATAPHLMYKMWLTEGAIVCPLIVRHPQFQSGAILPAFATVMDILPTILDFAGIDPPGSSYRGRKVAIPKGQSWVKYLTGSSDEIHSKNTVTGWELFGQQAIRQGAFKAVFIPKPLGPDKWQLFNIRADPGETKDLALSEPKILTSLLDHWAEYVAETGLVELGGDLFEREKINEEDTVLYNVIQD